MFAVRACRLKVEPMSFGPTMRMGGGVGSGGWAVASAAYGTTRGDVDISLFTYYKVMLIYPYVV